MRGSWCVLLAALLLVVRWSTGGAVEGQVKAAAADGQGGEAESSGLAEVEAESEDGADLDEEDGADLEEEGGAEESAEEEDGHGEESGEDDEEEEEGEDGEEEMITPEQFVQEFDIDKDGKISLADIHAFIESKSNEERQSLLQGGDKDALAGFEQDVAKIAEGFKKHFEVADGDKNGFIDDQEASVMMDAIEKDADL